MACAVRLYSTYVTEGPTRELARLVHEGCEIAWDMDHHAMPVPAETIDKASKVNMQRGQL